MKALIRFRVDGTTVHTTVRGKEISGQLRQPRRGSKKIIGIVKATKGKRVDRIVLTADTWLIDIRGKKKK